jgi:DNA-binding FrmR family transcriptional regulator
LVITGLKPFKRYFPKGFGGILPIPARAKGGAFFAVLLRMTPRSALLGISAAGSCCSHPRKNDADNTVGQYGMICPMAHATKEKKRLLARVRRIRGQVEAIERALEGEQECSRVLQLMAACRGALNSLMAEVMEGHIRFHVLSPGNGSDSPEAQAAEELIDVVRAYLK